MWLRGSASSIYGFGRGASDRQGRPFGYERRRQLSISYHRPVNTRPQGRLGQRRARTRVIEPRNLNRFLDELIAKVGGSNPPGAPVFTLMGLQWRP